MQLLKWDLSLEKWRLGLIDLGIISTDVSSYEQLQVVTPKEDEQKSRG